MTKSHTPCPWYKSTAENGLAVICHRNSDVDERVIGRLSSRQEIGDEVPDADLISAAPELLEVLKLAADYIDGPTAWTTEQEDALRKRLCGAIAKATGEA